MKILSALICLFLTFGCEQKLSEKVKINDLKTVSKQKKDSSQILDTIIFEKDMNGQVLQDKIVIDKSKLSFYQPFIHFKNKNKLVILNSEHTKTEIIYLGELKDLNFKESYQVITNFKIIGIGEMLSPRGHSEVAFINKRNNQILIYDLGMPDNLPKRIEDNVLQFEINNKKIGISISGGLPPLLCIPEIGCN